MGLFVLSNLDTLGRSVLEILCKKEKFCLCFEVRIPVIPPNYFPYTKENTN